MWPILNLLWPALLVFYLMWHICSLTNRRLMIRVQIDIRYLNRDDNQIYLLNTYKRTSMTTAFSNELINKRTRKSKQTQKQTNIDKTVFFFLFHGKNDSQTVLDFTTLTTTYYKHYCYYYYYHFIRTCIFNHFRQRNRQSFLNATWDTTWQTFHNFHG